MKKNIFRLAVGISAIAMVTLSSCEKELNLQPTNDVTSEVVFSTSAGYRQALAKVYGSFALTGNAGPAGAADIVGLDEGSNADFLRSFWMAQEVTTDEAVIAWGDAGVQDFHLMNWTSDNPFLRGLYFRSLYQITLANEFLRQAADDKLSARGITGADADEIRRNRAEVRFLRAFQYWVLMDLYGNPPFITEADPVGGPLPKQISRSELFSYVESELKAIEGELQATREMAYYGRATKGAAQALLARLYLNAEVYTGTPRYTEAITYAKNVISGGYDLSADYRQLTMRDNTNLSEFIFTINYDGQRTHLYGGTTFLTHAAVGGSMPAASYGIDNGWAGLRTTKNLVNLFPANGSDSRANFYTNGQSLEINSLTTFTDGYAVPKFTNTDKNGVSGPNQSFADIDFPLFRLPEMYLIYAESVLRGGSGGDLTRALAYINELRERAYGNTSGNLGAESLTLDEILNERARELYWEGHRRTDLIRFGRFVSSAYTWPWKGGAKDGKSVEDHRELFPLPSADVTANPNLKQNTGY